MNNTTTDPWSNAATKQQQKDSSVDWLDNNQNPDEKTQFDILNPFENGVIPFDDWMNEVIEWLVINFREVFLSAKMPIDFVLKSIESFLSYLHPFVIMIFFILISWQFASKKLSIMSLFAFLIIGLVGAWQAAMITLSLVLTAVLFCVLLGLPLGILSSKYDKFNKILQPILDAMQTTPAFVYLIPIVMLFGIGNVPGVIVTIIFALPPLIRLTNLGIRQVPADLIEAAKAFGANPYQLLTRVQIPMAAPTIMAGINQTLMLSLSMVVIASMIAVGGLGQMVLRGIGRLDIGLAAVGGLGIVLLAIVLDRLTQSFGKQNKNYSQRWFQRGPVGIFYKLWRKK
jgi:glycine betaine/proline transport system permease protein